MPDPSGAVVTEPGTPLVPPGVTPQLSDPLAFVSIAAGSLPLEATDVSIENTRTGAVVEGEVVDRGLDPVPIPAEVGDVLVVSVFRSGILLLRGERIVPPGRPPIVVRGEPPAGKIRVPINQAALVVFSEPMLASSLTPEAVYLEGPEGPVSRSIEPMADGVGVWLVPDEPLLPFTSYDLVVSGGQDLSGDPIAEAFRTSFVTEDGLAPDEWPGRLLVRSGDSVLAVDHQGRHTLFSEGWSGEVPAARRFPSFSPSGARVVWGGGGGFLVADSSGTDPDTAVALADLRTARVVFAHVVWSRDETTLALGTGSLEEGMDTYVAALSGSAITEVGTPGSNGGPGEYPVALSPDGSAVLYQRQGEPSRLYRIDVATGSGREVRLPGQPSTGAFEIFIGDWAPDGRWVAVAASDGDAEPEIHMLDLEERVPSYRVGSGFRPRWHPDGQWLAVECEDPERGAGICVLRPNGGDRSFVAPGEALLGWIR